MLLNGFRANANHRWPVIADSGWLGRKVRQANESVTYFVALLLWEADVREGERLESIPEFRSPITFFLIKLASKFHVQNETKRK